MEVAQRAAVRPRASASHCLGRRALALRTMPVAAGVVGDAPCARRRRSRSARHGRRAPPCGSARSPHMTFSWSRLTCPRVGFTPSRPVVAEDVRDLQSWPAHVGGAYAAGSGLCLFLGRWCVPPSCASGLVDLAAIRRCGDTGVARRRVELGMPKRPRAIMRTFYVTET